MNKTLRLAVLAMLMTVIAAALTVLGTGRLANTIPVSCDYYSSPTIATQYIDSADGLISTTSNTTTTVTTVSTSPTDTAAAADVIVSGSEVPAAAQTETSTTVTTTAPTTAATQPDGTQKLGELIITHEQANIRSDAGAEFELLGTVYNGERYEVYGTKNAKNDILWMLIKLKDGRMGYVCANFCRFDGILPGAVAYLTFDDGPTDNTPKILDILDRYNVKATFFVIYHSNRESTYKEIVNRGHTLALHSYSHEYEKIYKSEKAYFNDLEKLADYLEKVTGQRPKYMRFPGGSSNTISRKYCKGIMTTLTREVENRGYKYYDWNLDSGDASGRTVKKSKIIENIKNGVGKGGELMVLMHDAAAKTTTVEALPEIIEIFKKHGYDLRPITDDTPVMHQEVAN